MQNDYDTICSQLRQKEMQLEDLKTNLSEIVSYCVNYYNVVKLVFSMCRKINAWMLIKTKKWQTTYVLMLTY